MRFELVLGKGEMLICGKCEKQQRNGSTVWAGDTQEEPFAVLCNSCLEAQEDAMLEPVRQRISLEAMVDVFESLAESGEPFEVVFEKQDGTMREMRAMMLGPVQYSYSTRKRYANVTDLDISETGVNERKIVIQRVQSLIYQGFEFVPSGR